MTEIRLAGYTDSGDKVLSEQGDGNGEHWKNDSRKYDSDGVKSPASTMITGEKAGSVKWRIHNDMKVTAVSINGTWYYKNEAPKYGPDDEVEWYTTPHTNGDKLAEKELLDGLITRLDLPKRISKTIFTIVDTETSWNGWNAHYDGRRGAVLGYAAWFYCYDIVSANRFAREMADELDVQEPEKAVEYAFKRARERGIN